MVFSHGRSSKNGLWLHLGVILGRSCAHVGLTPPRDNTQQRPKSFLLGPPTQNHHFQVRLNAPTWPEDGPKMAQHGSRWLQDGRPYFIGFILNCIFAKRCCNKCILACSTTPATTYNYTQHHTPPDDNTQQHRKSSFKDLLSKTLCFKPN